MIVTDRPSVPARLRGYDLKPVGPDLWRVIAVGGLVIGHIAVRDGEQARFEARRFHAGHRAFVAVGTFCRLDDALATLHHAR